MKYVGIDIGDGESAVTVVSESGPMIPSAVMLGNVKSVRSVVGTLNGRPIIGDPVVLNHAVANRSVRFKSRFLTDWDAREDLRRFSEGLYELLKKGVKDKELKIALGCPAEWSKDARDQYAAIVASAGFSNLHTVSESRAAFLYAHYSNELNLSREQLSRPTLVIDIGSSTLDYAYIVDGRERDVGVFGEKQLGGGILDALILNDAVEKSPDAAKIRAVFQQSPSWRSYCELIARKVKETYFLSEEKYAQKPCRDIAPIYASGGSGLSLQISLSGEILERLLNQAVPELKGSSFRGALADSLQRAKTITAERPAELMILTGGASRMGFFRKMCLDTFPEAAAALCPEPELSIARGLGIAARTDDMLSRFRGKVSAYLESGAIETEIAGQLPHLLPQYVPVVSKLLQKKAVIQAVQDLASAASKPTVMEDFLKSRIDGMLADQEQTQASDQVVNKWIGERLTAVQERLNQLCDEFHIDRADMSLVKIHAEVQVPEFQLPLFLRILLGSKKSGKGIIRGRLISRMAGGVGKNMGKILERQLANPQGDFARSLSCQLVQQLQMQIDAQTRKVEIQIN